MFNCGNVEDKRRIIKDINQDFDINFCLDTETYLITHKGYPFMRVKWNEFTRETIYHIRHMVYLNENGSIEDEIEKNNCKVDKHNDNRLMDMARQMAKDIRKPLLREVMGV